MTDPAVLRPAAASGPEPSARPARTVTRDEGAAAMPTASPRRRRPSRGRLATVAMGVAMVALIGSWFTAWAMPLAIAGILLGLIALLARRAQRGLAWWAVGLGAAAVACSAFWIGYGLQRAAELAKLG